MIPKIDHIAVKVDDLDEVERFYETVFGFKSRGRSRSPERNRATVNNGEMDLIFLKYDSEEVEMAKAVGDGPAIHHFAIVVDNMEEYAQKIIDFGCEVLTPDPKSVPFKFRMPGGPIAEIIPTNRGRIGTGD